MMIPWFGYSIIQLKSKCILLFSLLLFAVPIHGQKLFFKQFSVVDGLAQSTVFKVIQDSRDIYWIGTQAGVTSFDGTKFTNYSVADGLSVRGVRAIFEDQSGNIWFGHTGGGICRYNGENFEKLLSLDNLIKSTVTSIVEDFNGHLWITTLSSGVIELLNPLSSPDSLEAIQYSGSDISDQVISGYLDPSGELFFVTDLGEVVFNKTKKKFENVIYNGVTRFHSTTAILVDQKGHTWLGKHNGGLFIYDPLTDTSHMYDLVELGLTSNWVTTLFEDQKGDIWVGTWGGGVIRFSGENDYTLIDQRKGLIGSKIWAIMEDKEGNILIATHENGFCVYRGDQFASFSKDDGLIGSQVSSVLQLEDGTIWYGTDEGISVLESVSGELELRDFTKLLGTNISYLKEDREGKVWIGSLDQGVFSYNRDGKFLFEPKLNSFIVNLDITAMDIDQDNALWVGTMSGLVRYEIENSRLTIVTQMDGLFSSHISAVYSDSRNRLWVGSSGQGISLIKGDSIIRVDLGYNFEPNCFTEDQDGNIWVGTEGRGVLLIDPKKLVIIKTLSMNDGLLSDMINQLNCDRFNNIYIGTNNGLNVYFNDNRLYSYTTSSGFVGIETRPNASMLDKDGNLWFGTVKGVTRIKPLLKKGQTAEPNVYITGLQVNHEIFPLDDGMRFSPKQNSFVFEYRSITLNPDAVQYQIMLVGVDDDWRAPNSQTSVIYPALGHGKYTFFVKARSSEGLWSDKPVSFQFEIMPPFYLTWYFIVSSIVAIGLIIIGYFRIRVKALKKENIILERKVAVRTALIEAQKEELTQKNKDITDSIRYAKRIQFAILPEKLPFKDTFVFFKPKDIVSGDFYWFLDTGDKQFLAAVDCTGHGVPGAFMSIIGHNSLNKIVKEYGILNPGRILDKLNQEVTSTFQTRSGTTDVMDGMDLSLICYTPDKNSLEFAGAYNPLYLIRNGEIIEVKGDRVSIGRSSYQRNIKYKTHRVPLKPKDTVYLFSDGYADQFGGEKMKKFNYRNFRSLLLKVQDKSMGDQRVTLDQTIEEWRGKAEQLDDILVVGRRF